MTKLKKFLIHFIVTGVVVYGILFCYKHFFSTQEPSLFSTEKPQKRSLNQIVSTSGTIEIKDVMKIGSQVAGIIDEIQVKENQFVKKGTILAKIALGKKDTDVRSARYRAIRTRKEYLYQKNFYARQKKLYDAAQLSKNAYERALADCQKARADFLAEKAQFEKNELELENTIIKAPDDGIVIAVNISKGIAVINDFQNVLFELAHDLNEMKVILDIDESEIGQVFPEQKVSLSINAYPDMEIKTEIKEVSFAPKTNGKDGGDCVPFYKAFITLDNKQRLLRPGMIVNAKINIDKAKDVLCISGLAFQINPDTVERISRKMNYEFVSIDAKQQKTLRDERTDERIRFIWTVQGHRFVQKAISIGVTDDTYWQVVSGITDQDLIVTDVKEPNEMDVIYKHWFKRAL